MKKILFLFFLFLSLVLLTFSVQGKAYTITESLSPAIDILKEKNEFRKGNMFGSQISFSQKDFEDAFSVSNFVSVKIISLPDQTVGKLMLMGNEIQSGQVIPKEELDGLNLIPTSCTVGNTEISFQRDGSDVIYTCSVNFSDHESQVPKISHISLNTYRNIPISAKLSAESNSEGIRYEIIETSKKGVLSLDADSGSFTYSPDTNSNGLDRFYYCAYDEYGNRSKTMCVSITVNKTAENLYFHDLAQKSEHRSAVFVCSKGIMNYTLDERGLPCFHPDEKIKTQELIQFGLTAIKTKGIFPKDAERVNAVFKEADESFLTEKESIKILEFLFDEYKCDAADDVFSSTDEIGPYEGGNHLSRLECAVLLEQFTKSL